MPTDATEAAAAVTSQQSMDYYERETQQLDLACARKVDTVEAKFTQLKELVKSQIELKRLVKRNQKDTEVAKKVTGRKRGPKPQKTKQ